MKTTMANKITQEFSSKKHSHWTAKVTNEESESSPPPAAATPDEKETEAKDENLSINPSSTTEINTGKVPILKSLLSSSMIPEEEEKEKKQANRESSSLSRRKKLQAIAVSRLKSVLTTFGRNMGNPHQQQQKHGLGTKLVGTLFGNRRGHVHFAFQKDPTSDPVFLVELATPITVLVREMASGLVRIALECDKKDERKDKKVGPLIEQTIWRTYCNGKKCGFANRRECGAKEWEILKAVEPISMGAGVLPIGNNGESGSEIMYMRAKFERVVGSRDSEAFYMMNPDSNGAPELSIYLLRV